MTQPRNPSVHRKVHSKVDDYFGYALGTVIACVFSFGLVNSRQPPAEAQQPPPPAIVAPKAPEQAATPPVKETKLAAVPPAKAKQPRLPTTSDGKKDCDPYDDCGVAHSGIGTPYCGIPVIERLAEGTPKEVTDAFIAQKFKEICREDGTFPEEYRTPQDGTLSDGQKIDWHF